QHRDPPSPLPPGHTDRRLHPDPGSSPRDLPRSPPKGGVAPRESGSRVPRMTDWKAEREGLRAELADTRETLACVLVEANAAKSEAGIEDSLTPAETIRRLTAERDAVREEIGRPALYSVREAMREAGVAGWEMGSGVTSADA